MPDNDETIKPAEKVIVKGDIRTPTIFSDRLNVICRSDDLFLLQWCFSGPENVSLEQARVVVTKGHVIKIIDLLARLADHYPAKPDDSKA